MASVEDLTPTSAARREGEERPRDRESHKERPDRDGRRDRGDRDGHRGGGGSHGRGDRDRNDGGSRGGDRRGGRNNHNGPHRRPPQHREGGGGGGHATGGGAHKDGDVPARRRLPSQTLAAIAKAGEEAEYNPNDCFVCCKTTEVFAIGECEHAICFECSTRMRVLCKNFECPACKLNVPEVFFVTSKAPFEDLKAKEFPLNDVRSCIYFETEAIKEQYAQLLEHRCTFCARRHRIAEESGERAPKPKSFASFEMLEQHLQKEHNRHFCHLCVEHLSLFTHERQNYSRTDLRRHMEVGDSMDKSYKGHPKCDFCNEHYLDKDELFKHLKKEHFFCFICSAQNALAKVFQYYATYDNLKEHFKEKHFLCEQGDCMSKKFMAFESEIDYKAHCVEEHSEAMSRQQQKQARNILVDFNTLAEDRQLMGADGRRAGGGGRDRGGRRPRRDAEDYDDQEVETHHHHQPVKVDTTSTTEFPTLDRDPDFTVTAPLIATPKYAGKLWTNPQSTEAFPSLEPTKPLSLGARSKQPKGATPNFRNVISSSGGQSSSTNRTNGASSSTMFGGVKAKTSFSMGPPPQLNAQEVFPSLPDGTLELKKTKEAEMMSKIKQKPKMGSWGAMGAGNITITTAKTKKKKTPVAPPSPAVDNRSFLFNGSKVGENGNVHVSNVDPTKWTAPSWSNGNDDEVEELVNDVEWKDTSASWGGAKKKQPAKDAQTPPKPKPVKVTSSEEFPSLGPAEKPVNGATVVTIKSKYKGRKLDNTPASTANRMKGGYVEPPYFTKRTNELLGMLKLLLDDVERVNEFRTLSASYRRDSMTANEFLDECIRLFNDTQEFIKILPEVIYLLPDIAKQNELLDLYVELKKNTTGAAPKTKEYSKCQVCCQILAVEDAPAHQKVAH